MLWHFRCRIRFSPESIQGAVIWVAFHIILQNPNGNRYVLYLYWNGEKWNWNYNWLDNDWDVNDPSAVFATRFVSLSFLRESFVL